MRKRIIALLLALILTVGLLPTVALAAEETKTAEEPSGVDFVKKLVTKNGKDYLCLEALVNGDIKTVKSVTPCDIVLVLDQSGSMDETVKQTTYTYKEVDCKEWSYNKVREYLKKGTKLYYQPCWQCGEAHEVQYWKNFHLFDDDTYQIGYQCGWDWYVLRDNGRDFESTSSDYVFYTGKLYTRTTTTTSTNKYQALKEAASAFLKTVSENAKQNKVDHRVAIVGFGSASDDYYRNTEILTLKSQDGQVGKNYLGLQANDYKDALVSCNTASGGINPTLTNAVDALAAEGATAVDLGLKMANNIFKNQTTGTYTGENARAKIVVVVTDGNPTHSDGFENNVATTAIQQAKAMKDASTKVFTIGIALGGDNAKKFISYVSSDYPNATSWSKPGQPIDAAPKYTSYVSDAEAMKEIFSDIASEATSVSASAKLTQTAVLTDTISQYFKLPEGAKKDSIEVYTSAAKFKDGAFTWDTEEKLTNANVKIDGQKVEVTGFDYTANCVTKTAKNNEGTDFGKKLVIYIPIEKDASKAQFGGYLPTNADATLNDPNGDNGDKGYKADGAHKDCAVVAPRLAGKTIEINAGESATTTDLFKNITPNGTEWPDGNNNAGVDLEYTIKDEQENVIATAKVPAGTSTVTWTFAEGKTDSNQYNEVGEYKFKIDCEATCKNKTAHEGSTANSTQATGTITVKRTTATVTLTKTITGLTNEEETTVRTNLRIYAKDSGNVEHELEKNATSGTYSAELAAGNYTIVEKNYDVTGYDCATSGDTTFTVVADTNMSLALTNAYTAKTHTISYEYTGIVPNGAPSAPASSNAAFKSEQEVADAPTLDGWTFSGWTTDDVTVTDGKFNMPNNNVVFTGSWTQRATATINYVVVPNGAGTLSSYNETKYVDDTTAAAGSTVNTTTNGYRFVGWYAEEGCTTLLTAESHYTPTKTSDNWTGATYYAKFEAIPTPGTNDLPKVDVICTNNVMGHDAKENNALLMDTYTVGKTQYDAASGIYTCEVTLNTPLGYIGNYNVDTPGFTHTDDPASANVTTITLKYENQSWKNETGNFKIYVICDTAKFDVTYTWTGLEDVDFDNDQHKAPTPPTGETVTKGNTHTVDNRYLNGSTVTDVDGNIYTFSGWNKSGTFAVQENTTISGTWTKSTGTFELDGKIFKSFTAPDGVQKDFYVTVTPQQGDTTDIRTGILSLTGSTTTDVQFNFYNSSRITFTEPNIYTYLVEETFDRDTHPDGIVDKIHFDTKQYLLTITVNNDLTVTHDFTAYPQTDGEVMSDKTITFYNTYYEDPNADIVTLDLSKYVTKTFESRHGKSATETFEAKVQIWLEDVPVTNAAEEVDAIAVYAEPEWPKEYTGTVMLSTGETKPFDFGGSITLDRNHRYRIRVTETAGSNTDVEYDKTVYETYVNFDYETKEVKWYEYNGNFSFTNTYTGIDDYYPIIIPTIINKDTGMLNKTDHFAYVIGYPDGTVHPNGQITRAEVATIFFRLLRDEVRDGAFTTSNSYSDVAYGKWYNNPISTMSALGIITGYPDGTFKPNKPITRAEFAAIAARFDETQSGKSATFSDVIGHWAAKEIGIAYYNDWIKGYPDGTFKPDQNITRAEAMTLINRVLERKPESPADLLTNMNKWTDNLDTSKWYYLDVQEATNSHGYTRKTFNYELWRQMLNDPDWSRYER